MNLDMRCMGGIREETYTKAVLYGRDLLGGGVTSRSVI